MNKISSYLSELRKEGKNFPFLRSNTSLILTWLQDGQIQVRYSRTNSKVGFEGIIDTINLLKDKQLKISGVWPGEYHTDIFELPVQEFLNDLTDYVTIGKYSN